MKNSRFSKSYRQTASKLHCKVGDILKESFGSYKIYQEYPVYKINPKHANRKQKFDWVILDLKIVIEVHGEQHYDEVTFGKGGDPSLFQQHLRDRQKMESAENAGYTYIVIPFWDHKIITADYIWDLYKKCFNSLQPVAKSVIKDTVYKKQLKEAARLYRKEQYQRQKELKKKERAT